MSRGNEQSSVDLRTDMDTARSAGGQLRARRRDSLLLILRLLNRERICKSSLSSLYSIDRHTLANYTKKNKEFAELNLACKYMNAATRVASDDDRKRSVAEIDRRERIEILAA